MALGSCTRYNKLRKKGREIEYSGAKGKTWLIDEALGRAVLRFPDFSEDLSVSTWKKKEKKRDIYHICVVDAHRFFFSPFFDLKEGRKKKTASDFYQASCQTSVITRKMVPSADTSGQLHAHSWCKLSNPVPDSNENGSPFLEEGVRFTSI